MRESEDKLENMFDEESSYLKQTTPNSAFIVFEEEGVKQMALDNEHHAEKSRQLFDFPDSQFLNFIEASEPTNIIWQNRHFTDSDYLKRGLIAYSIVALLILASFVGIFLVANYQAEVSGVFPQVNCSDVKEVYGDDLQNFAVQDYDFITSIAGTQSNGCLQCFCQDQYEAGVDSKETYGSSAESICSFYWSDKLEILAWTKSLAYSITGINFVLRQICIMLVTWIGYKDETVQIMRITTVVFIVQFFNTAFLMLLANANLADQPISFGMTFGDIPDFNAEWFKRIGNTIVNTMIYTSYFPIIEFIGFFGMREGFRLLDRGFCNICNKYATKKTAI